jgi:group II intron maturase
VFRRCIVDKAVTRFKDRVRELTGRRRGASLEKMIADLNPFVRGWAGYFGFSKWHELPSLDGWIRRRLRCVVWVQWKTRGLSTISIANRSSTVGATKSTMRPDRIGPLYWKHRTSVCILCGPEGGIVTRLSSEAVVDDLARALRRLFDPAGS